MGFLAAVVEGGLLTSFFAAGASLFGSCAAAGLPADGAVVTREAAVLPDEAVEEDLAPAEGGLVVAAGLDVVKLGLIARGTAASLAVFAAAAPALAEVEAVDFEVVEAMVLHADSVVLGLAPLTVSGAVLF